MRTLLRYAAKCGARGAFSKSSSTLNAGKRSWPISGVTRSRRRKRWPPQLARALHFRDETVRRLPVEKKADLLGSRIGSAEFEEHLELALMQYHTHEANEMMAAFLDRWGVPHVNGSIEAEDYTVPTAEQIRDAVRELSTTYDKRDIALYLASAGLLMTEEWREATWPVVDELT